MDFVGVLAFFAVFFYALNSQVLKALGKVKVCDPIALIWILHVVIAILAPYVYLKRKALAEELRRMKVTHPRFVFAVVFNSVLQMSVNLMFLLSAKYVPVQITAAIYQTSIGLVYVCSVLFLGEKVAFWKALGVSFAVGGVLLASVFPPSSPLAPINGVKSLTPSSSTPEEFAFGVAMAFGAMACKCTSQIYCKIQLQGGSGHFMFMYGIHMGIAHIYAILPAMLLLDSYGVQGMSFQFYDTSFASLRLLLAAVCFSTFVSFGYASVAVVRSPLFLCRFQVLGIIFAVTMDFLLHGNVPQLGGYCGYACILAGFVFISGLVDPSKAKEKTSSTPKDIKTEVVKTASDGLSPVKKVIANRRVHTPRASMKNDPIVAKLDSQLAAAEADKFKKES